MSRPEEEKLIVEDSPLWYRDAVIYELHVKTFYDSNEDGIGDFPGLTAKLDYLQDLGVTALWLLPFCPSPLKDDGYDISDYKGIHASYGTLRDFRVFLREAHRRGLRVITELPLNHTSDQHPWFQRARRAKPGSRLRDYYVWSDTPERYREVRIIFQDFEPSNWSWDPVAGAYYWHRFYSHQPDLNYDHPPVQREIRRVLDFWFGMGVDGLRLDAVPYLFEREGSNGENLPETHSFLKQLRAHIDARHQNRMLLAEANQWPEDSVAYFGEGDECHMAFHFPIMPRLFMALSMEDRFPIIDILDQTPEIPPTCQWAMFLRNHDELTLEMVTDEERDYMYRAYASDKQMRVNLGIRRRLAPLMENHRRRIELLNGLLFSLPGTPVLFYGDEIGMGDNVFLGDRNGVRTPMQWSADRNAGFSRANPQRLYLPVITDSEYHFESVNVEAQQNNRSSLLWWMKRAIALRKQFKAFGHGSMEFVYPDNTKVLAFIRRFEDECLLTVANLSRFTQYAELDLEDFQGLVPVELFGRTEFPRVGEQPYFLTMGPHQFYWFSLERPHPNEVSRSARDRVAELPVLEVRGPWDTLLRGRSKTRLERLLPAYLMLQRWFGDKARSIKSVSIGETLPIPNQEPLGWITLLDVDFVEGDAETYTLPLACVCGEGAERLLREQPNAAVARLRLPRGEEGILCDASADENFCMELLETISRRRQAKGEKGRLVAGRTPAFQELRGPRGDPLPLGRMQAEQSNTSVYFGDRLILKFYRRLQSGMNPDLEIGRLLTRKGFSNTPAVAGSLEYQSGRDTASTLAILHGFVPNQGDAWSYTLDSLGQYFENVQTRQDVSSVTVPRHTSLMELVGEEAPEELARDIGPYMETARLLGQRTAELHLVLASETADRAFAPEPFTTLYQRSLYQSMRNLTRNTFRTARRRLKVLPEDIREQTAAILEHEGNILERFQAILGRKMSASRIRCHGDYHLGQVLYTGRDFVIIDFEGEPARPISERRIKRSPLRDAAGMIRSFHYAAYTCFFNLIAHGLVSAEGEDHMREAAQNWYLWVSAAFLNSYLAEAAGGGFLPDAREELQVLLDIYILEKAVYELGYELNNRPDWVSIPIQGIQQQLSPGR